MFQWINKHIRNKLFSKIIIFYSCIAIIFITSLTYLSIYIIYSDKTEKILNTNSNLVQKVYTTVNSKYDTAEGILNSIYVNGTYSDSIFSYLKMRFPDFFLESFNKYMESDENISYVNTLHSFMWTSFRRDNNINSIMLYSTSQNTLLYYSKNMVPFIYENVSQIFTDEDAINTDKSVLNTKLNIDSNDEDIFSFIFNIKDPVSLDNLGKLIINFNKESLAEVYSNYHGNNQESGDFIVFSNKDILFSSSPTPIDFTVNTPTLLRQTDQYTKTDANYIKSVRHESIPITIMGIVPKKNIDNQVQSTVYIILVACLLSILGIISLLYLFTTSYSTRLYKITSAIKKIRKGDLEVRIKTENNKDELTTIANNINSMCGDLSNYIDQVYVSEVKQKTAELKYLQAQINPHFLYNTLESIRMRAAINGSLDVSEMIYSLATFFKNSLKTDTITTIEQEIEHSKLYLKLFQLRYSDRLTVYYDIDQAILPFSIVKLTLQPLVENYIVHGINLDSNNNKITIRGHLHDHFIIIDIEDNGCGISEEKLTHIKQTLRDKTDSFNIGISNVHERLAIVYGDNYSLAIDSEENIGTKITLTIPARKKGV